MQDPALNKDFSGPFIDTVLWYMKMDPRITWSQAAARAANDVLNANRTLIQIKLSEQHVRP